MDFGTALETGTVALTLEITHTVANSSVGLVDLVIVLSALSIGSRVTQTTIAFVSNTLSHLNTSLRPGQLLAEVRAVRGRRTAIGPLTGTGARTGSIADVMHFPLKVILPLGWTCECLVLGEFSRSIVKVIGRHTPDGSAI